MGFTNKQRFHLPGWEQFVTEEGKNKIYIGKAPLTLGAIQFYHAANLNEFKKTPEEKDKLKAVKANHKKELLKYYPEGVGKHLNIPVRSLPEKVINTF